MWLKHILPVPRMSIGQMLALLVTWPYHRSFVYFNLEPAAKLAEVSQRDRSRVELGQAIEHWRSNKDHEYDFVCNAV
jgi:hypothetical protein